MSGVKEYVLSFLRRFGCLPSACQFVPSRIIQAEAKVLFFLEHSSEPARIILGKRAFGVKWQQQRSVAVSVTLSLL
jgi:hypothetical protein